MNALLLMAGLVLSSIDRPIPGLTPEQEAMPLDEQLAMAAQNPVAALISIPFQDNVSFGVGPDGGVQNVLNIQPVVPLGLGPDWNLITRTILPIVTQPSFTGGSSTTGLGNLMFSAFLSPAKPGALIWGAGPVVTFPTATSPLVGSQSTWGLGPSVVLLTMRGHWVIGVLANNVWSVAGDRSNWFLLQYFVTLNFDSGWYVTTSPVITANWEAPPEQRWVVPFGAGFGRIVWIAGVPFNCNASAFVNAVRPDFGPTWSLRAQVTLMLPAGIF